MHGYILSKDYDKALEHCLPFEKYAEDLEKFQNDDADLHLSAFIYNAIGEVYKEGTKYDEAIEVLNTALKILPSIDIVTKKHSAKVRIYRELGLAYLGKDEISSAIINFKESINRCILPKTHPDTIDLLRLLAETYEQKNNNVITLEYWFAIYNTKHIDEREVISHMERAYQKISSNIDFNSWLKNRVEAEKILDID